MSPQPGGLSAQVLSDGQELVMEFQGEKFFLRVKSILVIDKKGEQASVKRGALIPHTAFVFDANTQSGIKVLSPTRRRRGLHCIICHLLTKVTNLVQIRGLPRDDHCVHSDPRRTPQATHGPSKQGVKRRPS